MIPENCCSKIAGGDSLARAIEKINQAMDCVENMREDTELFGGKAVEYSSAENPSMGVKTHYRIIQNVPGYMPF